MGKFKVNMKDVQLCFTAYLYYIEHKPNGKQYKFRSCEKLAKGDFVICDTKFGETYGKVIRIEELKAYNVDFEVLQMFDKGYEQTYKKCWKA